MASSQSKPLLFVGIGPGDPQLLTAAAQKALVSATVVIGASRCLESVREFLKDKQTFALVSSKDIVSTIESLKKNETAEKPGSKNIVVVFSGDPGFFSGATKLIALCQERGWPFKIVSGISSLVYFAGKLGYAWDELAVVSLHGRTADIVTSVRNHGRVFFLTDATNNAAAICAALTGAQLGECFVSVGERLSYSNEQITQGRARELVTRTFDALCVVIVEVGTAASMPAATQCSIQGKAAQFIAIEGTAQSNVVEGAAQSGAVEGAAQSSVVEGAAQFIAIEGTAQSNVVEKSGEPV